MHHLHQDFSQRSPSKTLHWQSAFTHHKASTIVLTLFSAKEFELLLQLLLKESLTDSAKPETITSAPEFA